MRTGGEEMIYDYETTIDMLQYIADSPPREQGGFHENTIDTARSALYYLKQNKELRQLELNNIQLGIVI